jgi:predicted transposase YbfD/YdcC
VQSLLGTLGLTGAVVTVDAMHCQKKPYVDGSGSARPFVRQAGKFGLQFVAARVGNP